MAAFVPSVVRAISKPSNEPLITLKHSFQRPIAQLASFPRRTLSHLLSFTSVRSDSFFLQFSGTPRPPNLPPYLPHTSEEDGDYYHSPPSLLPVFARQPVRRPPQRKIRIAHLLLALNVAIFVFQTLLGPTFTQSGAKVNALIAQGQVHRLLTPMFLHGSMSHLLVNSFSLYSTGPSVESWFGKRRFMMLYILSGLSGNILSYMCTPSPSIGASGAIFGLVGASAVIMGRHREILGGRARSGLRSLVYVVAINFGMGLNPAARIDNFGHLGGFLGGLAYSYMAGPRLVKRKWGGRVMLVDRPLWKDVIREANETINACKRWFKR